MKRFGVAITLVAVLIAGCSDDGDDAAATSTSTSTTSTTAAAQGSPQDKANEITIKDFAFDPTRVTVSEKAVAIKLTNTGSARHTFTIDDPKVDFEIAPGTTTQALVALGDKTEASFYCRFHPSQMKGTIAFQG